MKTKTLTGIIAGLLATALTVGSVSSSIATERKKITDEELQAIADAPIEPPKLNDIEVRFTPSEYPAVPLGYDKRNFGWGELHVGGWHNYERGSRTITYISGNEITGTYEPQYNHGYRVSDKFIHSLDKAPDYKDELFEVKLRPQATAEIQSYIARWHILKNEN
ncbi:MAG: hypothetical protein KKH88_04165 [Nanoarchaeota archaeon]|nr:hypothetical protein [Nanoarchaeota archaeon]